MYKKSILNEYEIVSGEQRNFLAESFAEKLKKNVIYPVVTTFANGEQKLILTDSIKQKKIILIFPVTPPVDTNFVQLLLILSALEHMDVKEVLLVIPWMGYSLQDRVFLVGEPLSSEVISQSLSRKIVSQVVLIDVHKKITCDHFLVPATSIDLTSFFTKQIKKKLNGKVALIVSPDNGGYEHARVVSKKLKLPFAYFDKNRDRVTGEIVSKKGQPINKGVADIAVIYDDGILSGSTIVSAAEQLREIGFQEVLVFATHGLLLHDALEKILSIATKVFVSNTVNRSVELSQNQFASKRFEIIDLSGELLSSLEKLVK